MQNFKYLGVQNTPRKMSNISHIGSFHRYNPTGTDDRKYISLGQQLRNELDGIGQASIKINPQFDVENSSDINILSSYRHDVMDIAEAVGRMPESSKPLNEVKNVETTTLVEE